MNIKLYLLIGFACIGLQAMESAAQIKMDIATASPEKRPALWETWAKRMERNAQSDGAPKRQMYHDIYQNLAVAEKAGVTLTKSTEDIRARARTQYQSITGRTPSV